MSFISMEFLVFVFVAVSGYYLIPKKFQWIWLLVFSYIYYLSSGVEYGIFIVYTTVVTYAAGRLLELIDRREKEKERLRKQKRRVILAALLLDFGLLAVLKYTNFAISNINALFGAEFEYQNLLLPLGISFYTFQSVGYIMDVYWKRCEAERNLFRFALFVSFFPQILQGPIGRYHRLAHQLYEPHSFQLQRIQFGLQRIVWGYFKKLVIADTAAIFVNAAFDEYQQYPGLAVVGVLAYCAQLYGDFSGGMDVVIGIAELFGIRMDENFKRPFFSVSITDFWHRWHITLGTWMKDYVFYPFSLSRLMNRFGKFTKKCFGKTYGRLMPICLANIVVFLVVGVWHGAAWKFIVYGLYNGVIIAFSGLMANHYKKWIRFFRINAKSRGYHVFQIVRTFVLVNISLYFDRADTLSQAFAMMKNALTCFRPAEILEVHVGTAGTTYTVMALGVLLFGCAVQFVVSCLEERGVQLREALAGKAWILRWAVYLAVLFAIPMLGQPPDSTGGFIYAQF